MHDLIAAWLTARSVARNLPRRYKITAGIASTRLGLGTVVMTVLGEARRSPASRQVLVATEDGRRLYSSLAWTVSSAYSTAINPASGLLPS